MNEPSHLISSARPWQQEKRHAATPGSYLAPEAYSLVAAADVVLSFDYLDLASALTHACAGKPFLGKVIPVSCDAHNHRGWSMDHQALPPSDVYLMCETEVAVPLLLDAMAARAGTAHVPVRPVLPAPSTDAVSMRGAAIAMAAATRGIDVCYTRFPLGWNGDYTHLHHPMDHVGHDGGAGVGSGPGMTVGAGLALKGTCRLPVALIAAPPGERELRLRDRTRESESHRHRDDRACRGCRFERLEDRHFPLGSCRTHRGAWRTCRHAEADCISQAGP